MVLGLFSRKLFASGGAAAKEKAEDAEIIAAGPPSSTPKR